MGGDSDETKEATDDANAREHKEQNAAAAEAAPTPDAEKKPRKKPQRKPIWVAIPTDFESDADSDAQRATKYSLAEFPGGPGQTDAIRKHLAANGIDPTNFRTVLMWRGAPLDFEMKVSKQTILRFL